LILSPGDSPRPVYITNAGTGAAGSSSSSRRGVVKIIKDGIVLATPVPEYLFSSQIERRF